MGGTYKAPDMAAANREAVMAQSETYPLLRQIEAAARLGTKGSYVDPSTGKTRNYDFSGISDIDVTRETARALAQMAPELTGIQLETSRRFGTDIAKQRRAELEAADPERYRLYDQFLRGLQGEDANAPSRISAPELERVANAPDMADTGTTADIRSALERQILGELGQSGTLPPGLERGVQQALRARGAATGNILGNASALREALGVSQATAQMDQQRRAQAMGLLQSGQSTSDTRNRLAQQSFQNILAATGQRTGAAQQTFANQLAAQQQGQALGQQRIANIQSALGLAPIVSQAAQLGGLQQGAVATGGPGLLQGMQQAGPGQLLQMGSQFALQNAQNEFQASQANSPLAIAKGVTSAIGSLSGGLTGCHVARLCIPGEWEAFYFWKELLAPEWFRDAYNRHSRSIAGWLQGKPRFQKAIAGWMRSKIKEVTHG